MSKKSNPNKQNKTLNPIERAILKKAQSFIDAERLFWKKRYEVEAQYRKNASMFELGMQKSIPDNLSSEVWALKDGVAFVRYYSPSKQGEVHFKVLNITLEEWGNDYLLVPYGEQHISLAKMGMFRGLGNVTFQNCKLNEVEILYAELVHLFYDHGSFPNYFQDSIIDFQLSLLATQSNMPESTGHRQGKNFNKIDQLKLIVSEFECLLEDATKEEQLQIFLKKHPMLLSPTASQIPKQKLGSDFVTDFVLAETQQQGSKYILVEIEKSTHRIFLNDNSSLSKEVDHAIKQTVDWDVWLEKNKAYLQGKLPNFETPEYLIVIGRGNQLDENANEYLRSYNRRLNNTQILTYDDLLVRFKKLIEKLECD